MKTNVIMSVALFASLAVPAHAEPYNYATFVPPAHSNNTLALEPAFKKIAEETGGEVELKIFAGGQLLGGREMLAGLRDGIADAGFVAPSYFISEMPNANLLPDMMVFGGDSIAVAGAMLETMLLDCAECANDFTKNNLVYLGGQVPTPYRLLCKPEVSSAVSLKGLRMRGGGTAMSRTAEALGGIAISMSSGDMYEAMERGALDCVVGPVAWLKQYSLNELVKYVVEEPLGVLGGLSLLTFNADTWKKLSEKNRKIILRQMPFIVAASTISGFIADDIRAQETAMAEHDVKFIAGDESVHAAVTAAKSAGRDAIIATAKERGVENPEAIMDVYLENLEKWRKISQETVKGDAAALEKVLWDEIYSKLDI